MTYYEWVSKLEELKTGPRNEEIIQNLYQQTIELNGNILYRFIRHINDVVRTRLKNTLEKMLSNIERLYKEKDNLSLEIINIKKELYFAKQIINLPVIPDENKNKFRETLQKFANEINEALISSLEGIDTTGEALMMIKNSKINILED